MGGQFHQHFVHVTRKKAAKMTFLQKIRTINLNLFISDSVWFNVDEIGYKGQFHQHFTHILYAHRSKSPTKTNGLTVVFALLGSACV